jgi:hypothetical protein
LECLVKRGATRHFSLHLLPQKLNLLIPIFCSLFFFSDAFRDDRRVLTWFDVVSGEAARAHQGLCLPREFLLFLL